MLVLVRHGQRANAEGRLAGHLDVGLTDLGELQATAVAQAVLSRRVPAPAWCPARSCGPGTAAAFGLPVEVDVRWIELDYGPYDGLALADVPQGVWRQLAGRSGLGAGGRGEPGLGRPALAGGL